MGSGGGVVIGKRAVAGDGFGEFEDQERAVDDVQQAVGARDIWMNVYILFESQFNSVLVMDAEC